MTTEGLLQQRVMLRPEVRVGGRLRRGREHVHLVLDRRTGKILQVGPREHFIISRLDGTRSLGDIGADYAQHFGRRLGENGWHAILLQLGARRLLAGGPAQDGYPTDSGAPSRLAQPPCTPYRGRVVLFSAGSKNLDRVVHWARFVLDKRFMLPAAVLAIVMEIQLARDAGTLGRHAWGLRNSPALLLAVLAALAVSTVLHELAHAVVARHHGARVTEFGLRWRLPLVTAYCKADEYLLLPTRWQQVATAGAGVYVNLLFLLPFFAAWMAIAPEGPLADALAALLLAGSALGLVNLAPWPPFDGYKMLSHALGMSGYAAASFQFVRLAAARVLGRGNGLASYPGTVRVAYTAYAVGSAALAAAALSGLALLCHRFLADRFGYPTAVVVVVLVAGAAASPMAVRWRRPAGGPHRRDEKR